MDKNVILSCNSLVDEHIVLNWLSRIVQCLLYTGCVIIWWLNAIKPISLLGARHDILANVPKTSSYEKMLLLALSLNVHWINSRSICKNIQVRGFNLFPKSGFAGVFTVWQHCFPVVLGEKLFYHLLNSFILFLYAFTSIGFAFVTRFSI